MRLKLLPLLGGLLLFSIGSAWGASGFADPVFDTWGNKFQSRAVTTSTDTIVNISSAITNASLGTEDPWRIRHIVNIGGDELVLYPDDSNYDIFESTRGIHLSSYTQTSLGGQAPYPRERWIKGNFIIYGIWNTSGNEANTGAIVNEFYDKR